MSFTCCLLLIDERFRFGSVYYSDNVAYVNGGTVVAVPPPFRLVELTLPSVGAAPYSHRLLV